MKIAIVLFIFALVIVGCAIGQGPIQIQVDPNSKEVIAKIAARHLGAELQNRYPDVTQEILVLSKDILIAIEDEKLVTLTDKMASVLTVGISDPLLTMDVKDLISLIKIDVGVGVTEDQRNIIKTVARGLVSGIELGGGE
jgi:hypothetical protein